jgi:hypothetical protein
MASSVPNAGTALEQAKIAGVRQAWMQAVRDGDANRLANFVTVYEINTKLHRG